MMVGQIEAMSVRAPQPNQSTSAWTDDLIDEVKDLWKIHSGAEIASILNQRGYTFSRSAIVAKLHRLGLTVDSKTKVNSKTNCAPRSMPVQDETHALRVYQSAPSDPLHIPLSDLEPHHCRFPFGDDPKLMTFCGHKKEAGSSYCSEHRILCRGLGTVGERNAA